MKKYLFLVSLVSAFVIFCITSCKKNEIEKVNIDNSFAVSVFSDTIKINNLLQNLDSTAMELIKVKDDGTICAYYSTSIENAVVAQDIMSGLDNIYFETSSKFDVPEIPASPVPIPLELPLKDFISIPFSYEGYAINSVVLKQGIINFYLSTNLNIDGGISLTTDNIKLANGESLTLPLQLTENQHIDIDLTNCVITPTNGEIVFSAMISATISDAIGGEYHFDMTGNIKDIYFKSIDGAISDTKVEFSGNEKIDLNIPNIYGDLKIKTPNFSIKYINSFGFKANGSIDSLYFTDAYGNKTGLLRDWNNLDIELHSTGESYDSITNIDESLVEEINILEKYKSLTFNGNVVLGCDNVGENMIEDDSHIDIIANLELPLEINIENLNFVDTIDFNLSFGEDNENGEGLHVENFFDDIEFKLTFKNKLPLQIKPQIYLLENNNVIDSVFDGNTFVHGCIGTDIMEDVLIVHVNDETIIHLQNADKLVLDMGLSSLGNDVIINANDYFHLRVGLKTKTTEIYMDDLNF